ncbi:MAG: hypothetical protein JWN99_382, partial [Ilumatobacteraceae bacterium]|nr:hypothetical protein [Ilumatobacteraceae bacterium]
MKVRFAFFAEHATMAGPWTVHAQNAGWVELQAAELPARVHLPLCLQLE